MANMNVQTPRFYIDYIGYLLSRGVAQNTNFDVTATANTGSASATRGLQTGTVTLIHLETQIVRY